MLEPKVDRENLLEEEDDIVCVENNSNLQYGHGGVTFAPSSARFTYVKRISTDENDTAVSSDSATFEPHALSSTITDPTFTAVRGTLRLQFDDVSSSQRLDDLKENRSWTILQHNIHRLKALRCFAQIRTFVAAISLLITVHGCLSVGYTMSVITTVEKRFQYQSSVAGFIVSSYEFGSLLSVLFVSYLGSQRHIPRWIGCGAILLAVGSCLWSMPHFVTSDSYFDELNREFSESSNGSFALDANDSNPAFPFCSNEKLYSCKNTNETDAIRNRISVSGNHAIFILFVAQIFLGVGGSPIFTLGTAYIDNHVTKESSSVYLACMYVCAALGPVFGFLLGGLMLSEYVNPNGKTGANVLEDSPYWIGCWWAGYLICGFAYFLVAWPFFCLPRQLFVVPDDNYHDLNNSSIPYNAKSDLVQSFPSPSRFDISEHQSRCTTPTPSDVPSEYGRSIKDIPVSVMRLLRNRVYIVCTMGACLDLAVVAGVTTFLPKYLETQFYVSKSFASVLTGSVAVPGACLGILVGGWLVKRLRIELLGAATMIIIANLMTLSFCAVFFFLGCNNLKVAGATHPYHLPFSSVSDLVQLNVSDPCNAGCQCSLADVTLVCGQDGLTYLSPCWAGCSSYELTASLENPSKLKADFTGCQCVSIGNGVERRRVASEGACLTQCKMLWPFLVLLFLLTFVGSTIQMPTVMLTLRSVSEDEKAFALGLQVVVFRLGSYIPWPSIFGAVIDTSCLVWKQQRCTSSGSPTACMLYDIQTYRIRYVALAIALKVIGGCINGALWFSVRRRHTPFSAPITMSEIARRLGSRENLHLRKVRVRSWLSDESLYQKPKNLKKHQKTRSC